MIAAGPSFPLVVSHMRVIEKVCLKAYRDSVKRPRYQYGSDIIYPRGEHHLNRGYLPSQPIRPIASTPQVPRVLEIGYGSHDGHGSSYIS